MAILPVGFAVEAGGYQIERSLRFNSADTAYLTRTYGTPTNNKVWTWSAWVKRGSLTLADANHLFMASPTDISGNPTTYSRLVFETDNTLRLQSNSSAGEAFTSNAVFRDPSAWYHIVLYMDAANTTVKCYVNGTEISYASRTNPSNTNTAINGAGNYHRMGLFRTAEPRCFNGYMTEINFIDGQALTPSSFGEFDTDTGVWKPKAYSGSYGTNGFYLDFADNSSTTALGYDAAGSNDWTPNNFSVTAGAGNDSLVDSPTRYGTDTGVGGEVRGNYATWNPIRPSGATITNGNLDAVTGNAGSSNTGYLTSTIWLPTSGKWYFEITPTSVGEVSIGLTTESNNRAAIYYRQGDVYINGSVSFTGSSYTSNDVIGVAVDMDALTIRFYKNNTAQGSGTSSLSGMTGPFVPCVAHLSGSGSSTVIANFGARPFSYSAPSGFKALCTTNLP